MAPKSKPSSIGNPSSPIPDVSVGLGFSRLSKAHSGISGSDSHLLETSGILTALRSNDQSKQKKAARRLRELIDARRKALPIQLFNRFMDDLYNVVLRCSPSDNSSAQSKSSSRTTPGHSDSAFVRGGIFVVFELLGVELEENEVKLIRFTNFLRLVLQQREEFIDDDTLVLAAKALGQLCRCGGSFIGDVVEFESNRAFEWLYSALRSDTVTRSKLKSNAVLSSSSREIQLSAANKGHFDFTLLQRRRLAAMLVIREFVINTPALFFSHVSTVFDLFHVTIVSKSEFARKVAASTLGACLRLVLNREPKLCVQWYYKVYELCRAGFSHGSCASIHGALLSLGELVPCTGKFMLPRFSETCESVLQHKTHPSSIIRQSVILLLPLLAEYSAECFVRHYFDDTIAFLFASVKKSPEQVEAYLALGRLSVAVGEKILPYLTEIVLLVREGLSEISLSLESNKNSSETGNAISSFEVANPLSNALYVCISMLAKAAGDALLQHKMIDGLLGEMFKNGLSLPLVDAVSELRRHIPSMNDVFVSYMLHALSLTISDAPFRPSAGGGKWPEEHPWNFGTHNPFEHVSIFPQLEDSFPASSYSTLPQDSATLYPSGVAGNGHSCSCQTSRLASTYLFPRQGDEDLMPASRSENIELSVRDLVDASGMSSNYSASFYPSRRSDSLFIDGLENPVDSLPRNTGFCCSLKDSTTKNLQQILLAIKTLREVDFGNISLLAFLSESVVNYLGHHDAELRLEAARTCGALILSQSKSIRLDSVPSNSLESYGTPVERMLATWSTTARLTSFAVRRMLMVGVSDSEPRVRETVLEIFVNDEGYDDYVVQEDTLNSLFVAFQDENFRVRRAAITLATRLAAKNSALVQPAIRKCVLTSMAQLEFSPYEGFRDERAVTLLGDVVAGLNNISWRVEGSKSFRPLLAPVIVSLLHILLSKLRGASHSMAGAILRTIGEVAHMESISMIDYMDGIMPLIVEIIQDQGCSEKQHFALQTLIQLIRSTTDVISPLLKYPGLLDALVAILRSHSTSIATLHDDALRAFGTLGALDPDLVKLRVMNSPIESTNGNIAGVDSGMLPNSQKNSADGLTSNVPLVNDAGFPKGPKDENFYPSVAISALIRVLQEPALSSHHSMSTQALTQIFRSLGLYASAFLPQVMHCLLNLANSCDQELRKIIFQNISVTISISKQFVRPYLDDIVSLLANYWYENITQVLIVLEDLSRALREEFVPYVRWIMPNILAVLEVFRDQELNRNNKLLAPSVSRKASVVKPSSFFDGIRSMGGKVFGIGRSKNDFGHTSQCPGNLASNSGTGISQPQFRSLAKNEDYLQRGVGNGMVFENREMIRESRPSYGGLALIGNGPTGDESRPGSPINLPVFSHWHDQGNVKFMPSLSLCRVFTTIEVLGFTLTDYFYLLIPALADLIEGGSTICEAPVRAMHTLARLSEHAFFCDYALNIIQCLLGLLRKLCPRNLRMQAVDTLCVFALRFPQMFLMIKPSVDTVIKSKVTEPFAVERYEMTMALISQDINCLSNEAAHHLDSLLSSLYLKAFGNMNDLSLHSNRIPNDGLDSSNMGLGDNFEMNASPKQLPVNQAKLVRAWEASELCTSEEWNDWIRRIAVELLRESPNPALRACSAVAQVFTPLASQLFNAAFVSCWIALRQQHRSSIVKAIESAMKSSDTPIETLQILLDLAEFMERDNKTLPIEARVLGYHAQRCRVFAKALHYAEIAFRKDPGSCTESLITINIKLEQPEAAVGILHYVQQLQQHQSRTTASSFSGKGVEFVNMLDFGVASASSLAILGPASSDGRSARIYSRSKNPDGISFVKQDSIAKGHASNIDEDVQDGRLDDVLELKEVWFERLGRWEEALAFYERNIADAEARQLAKEPESHSQSVDSLQGAVLANTMGMIRCLIRLGEFNRLNEISHDVWGRATLKSDIQTMALIFAQSSWVAGDWTAVEEYTKHIPEHNLTSYMLRALLALQHNDFPAARSQIDGGRELLGERVSALLGESYNRAYRHLVVAQQFAELDEICEFRRLAASGHVSASDLKERASKLQTMWQKRLFGCQNNFVVWQNVIGLHSLVVPVENDIETYVKFSNICRKSGRLGMSSRILKGLGISEDVCIGEALKDSKVAVSAAFEFIKCQWECLKHSDNQLSKDYGSRGASMYFFGGGVSDGMSSVAFSADHLATRSTFDKSFLASALASSEQESERLGIQTQSGVIIQLKELIDFIQKRRAQEGISAPDMDLLIRCYLKYGKWKFANEGYVVNESTIDGLLDIFSEATKIGEHSYKAWHAWALMNFRAVEFYSRRQPVAKKDESYKFSASSVLEKENSVDTHLHRRHSKFEPKSELEQRAGNLELKADSGLDCSGVVKSESSDNGVLEESVLDTFLHQDDDDIVDSPSKPSANSVHSDHCNKDEAELKENMCASPSKTAAESNLQNGIVAKEITTDVQQEAKSELHPGKSTSDNQLIAFEVPAEHIDDLKTISCPNSAIRVEDFVVPAVSGFFRSVALGQMGDSSIVLQDVLRLLTLWFEHSELSGVESAMLVGIENVNISTWLHVIPQLIARIHIQTPQIMKILYKLLVKLGKKHPQALVYPLAVAAKSMNMSRRRAARKILKELRASERNETGIADLISEAELVSHELIRVAILSHEEAYEIIVEAGRMYFDEKNIEGMIKTLDPLHKKLDEPFETAHELDFHRKFGRELNEAAHYVNRYKRSGSEAHLGQAWQLYYMVFMKIQSILQQELKDDKLLRLDRISPLLLGATNLQLAVPGTYSANKTVVRIDSFAPNLRMIVSKQRPRQVTIYGSDGRTYLFLLKGREDLRQDERVMQLFGLVNALLKKERETSRQDLSIERYSIIPLSHNVGISEWLDNTDTFHMLIEKFRKSRRMPMDTERRLIAKFTTDYDKLAIVQKLETFCYALEQTDGHDLAKCLWLRSRNSEIWLDRRTAFTRSLATMSMVGYILGLGDRHPSNLMMDRSTGKVIHIDFGDCFEVAMHRKSYPEKVPFRLTRMIVKAMEVSGVEGNFRYTCESVMHVLRDNRDSVIALLQAFIYDPLINWRLIAAKEEGVEPIDRQDAPDSDSSFDLNESKDASNKEPTTLPDNERQVEAGTSLQMESSDMLNIEKPNGNFQTSLAPNLDKPDIRVTSSTYFSKELNYAQSESIANVLRPRARTDGFLEASDCFHPTSDANGVSLGKTFSVRENDIGSPEMGAKAEVLNQKALSVLQRIHDKLTGMDFAVMRGSVSGLWHRSLDAADHSKDSISGSSRQDQVESSGSSEDKIPAPVSLQVHRLIIQATLCENLCVAFSGWCSTW